MRAGALEYNILTAPAVGCDSINLTLTYLVTLKIALRTGRKKTKIEFEQHSRKVYHVVLSALEVQRYTKFGASGDSSIAILWKMRL